MGRGEELGPRPAVRGLVWGRVFFCCSRTLTLWADPVETLGRHHFPRASPGRAACRAARGAMLGSRGGCSRLHQTAWLKLTPQGYYLTGLGVRDPSSVSRGSSQVVGRQDWCFLEALGENPFPCLFQLLEAACIPWLVAPSSTLRLSLTLFPSSCHLLCFSPSGLLQGPLR